MRRVVQRIVARHEKAHFCYEAGPTGYGLHRSLTAKGKKTTVVCAAIARELAVWAVAREVRPA